MKSKCEFCGGEAYKEIEIWEGKPPITVCKKNYEAFERLIREYDEDNDYEITDIGIKLRKKNE